MLFNTLAFAKFFLVVFLVAWLLVARPSHYAPVTTAKPKPGAHAQAATPATMPQTAATPAPEGESTGAGAEGQDLIDAMNNYLTLINGQEYAQAVAMRADHDVPSLDKLKKIKHMAAASIRPYPRISRDRGSLYVELAIEKVDAKQVWKGRIDWEKRGAKWVMVKWDSHGQPPSTGGQPAAVKPAPKPKPKPAAAPAPAAKPKPKAKPGAAPKPKPKPTPSPAAAVTPKPGDAYDFSFTH